LPPIQSQNNPQNGYGQQSIDHIISEPPSQAVTLAHQSDPELYLKTNQQSQIEFRDKEYLPVDPIYLSPQEEQGLMNDVSRELGSYRSDDLKQFYAELTSYDPNLTGFTHHTYISLVAMRNRVVIFFVVDKIKINKVFSLNF
jgi:hypothetical protein